MANAFTKDDITIAPGVMETIVALAATGVEGVAGTGHEWPGQSGFLKTLLAPKAPSGVSILEEDGNITVELHIQVFFGYKLFDVAAAVRSAVANAIDAQTGVIVSNVNVFIDSIKPVSQ
ncbi:MAG: Asp23/Gls24 family envelope stress response protein [Coriobacteriales bacterium]|jgi:uncharacterized alkaline shock family protein YloU|nr:Asp23/Gls24 family envelope stress response protein [Coriobacteriales bacterium]